jgi:hypothetical protein
MLRIKAVTHAGIPGEEYDLFNPNIDTHTPTYIVIAWST